MVHRSNKALAYEELLQFFSPLLPRLWMRPRLRQTPSPHPPSRPELSELHGFELSTSLGRAGAVLGPHCGLPCPATLTGCGDYQKLVARPSGWLGERGKYRLASQDCPPCSAPPPDFIELYV